MAGRPALAARGPHGWTELSYGELSRAADRVACWLAGQSVGPGARVAISGEAGAEWVAALFGVWRLGAVAVPIDAGLGPHEVGPMVERCGFSAAVVSGGGRRWAAAPDVATLDFAAIADLADRGHPRDTRRRSGNPALIVWTSGTSGAPKGVTLSVAGIAYVVERGRLAHALDGDDRWLSVLPLNHMLELSCGLLPALASGATFAFAGTTDPALLASTIAERHITRLTVVPRILGGLLGGFEADGTPPGELTLHCGGAAVDAAVVGRLDQLGVNVCTGYGLTETSPTVAMNTPAARRDGSVGRPLPGTEVRIADGEGDGPERPSERGDGEILVRSPGLMLGYWGDDTLTSSVIDAAGWFRTGDLGRLDDDGFLYVTGRSKSLIVLASGKKVQPEEVEAALAPSAVLAEACVVGWVSPDSPAGGEQVGAVVVASPDLRSQCRGREALWRAATAEVARLTAGLARFKRPGVVVVVDELPRTPKRSVRRDEVVRLLDRMVRESADRCCRPTTRPSTGGVP